MPGQSVIAFAGAVGFALHTISYAPSVFELDRFIGRRTLGHYARGIPPNGCEPKEVTSTPIDLNVS